jgi:hypothetical protein
MYHIYINPIYTQAHMHVYVYTVRITVLETKKNIFFSKFIYSEDIYIKFTYKQQAEPAKI